MASDNNRMVLNVISEAGYKIKGDNPTMDEYINAVFKIEDYKPSKSSFLSSSYCGMLELYQDYCKMRNNNVVIDFDKERREYLSSRSASDTVINLVKWFNGYYEGETFKLWIYL
jgi:hypothetical protein